MMRMISRSTPMMLLMGAALFGCGPSSPATPGPKADAPAASAPVVAAANEVVMDVPGMT